MFNKWLLAWSAINNILVGVNGVLFLYQEIQGVDSKLICSLNEFR